MRFWNCLIAAHSPARKNFNACCASAASMPGRRRLSRDIRELGLAKTSTGYSLPGREVGGESDLPSVSRLVREFVTSVRAAQNLLVTKTSIGSAQPVAAALDGENWPEALGTIAGDDTILIVCEDKRSAGRLAGRIQGMLA